MGAYTGLFYEGRSSEHGGFVSCVREETEPEPEVIVEDAFHIDESSAAAQGRESEQLYNMVVAYGAPIAAPAPQVPTAAAVPLHVAVPMAAAPP